MRLFDIAPTVIYAAMMGGFAGISLATDNTNALGLSAICAGLLALCIPRDAKRT